MSAAIDFLSEHGATLAVGATGFLGIGWLVVLVASQPIHKQRLAETSVIAAVMWLGLAVAPWPRSLPAATLSDVGEFELSAVGDEPPTMSATTIEPPIARVAPSVDAHVPSIDLQPRRVSEPLIPPDSTSILPVKDAEFEQSSIRLALLLATTFLIAALTAIAALVIAWFRLRRLVRRSTAPSEMALEIWNGLHPPKRSRLLVGSTTPLSFGIWKPTVLAPSSLVARGGPELEAVLRHELAHVRNRDALSRAMFNAAMPILALHPVYWLLRRQATFAAELRADADAAEPVGAGRYVESLVAFFNTGGRPSRRLAASTVWASESEFCRRMTMLLKRDGSLSQRTSRTWRTSVAAFSALVITVSASQFGVVYAQSSKTKSDGAVNPLTNSSTATVADAFDPINQEPSKTIKPSQGRNPYVRTNDLSPSTVTTTESRLIAEDAGASLFDAIPKAEIPAAIAGSGDLWNALALQIADRKAKLAMAEAANAPPNQRLQLEVEIIHLDSAKRVAVYEQELRQVEARLFQMDTEEASAEVGANHPVQKRRERAVAVLQKRRAMLQDMIEKESARTKQLVQQRAERFKQETQAARSKSLESPSRTPPSPKSADPTVINKLQSNQQALSANLHQTLQENARLRDQIAAQTQSGAARATSLLPTMSAARSNMDFSAPVVKHKIRMAEAELPLLEQKIVYYETERKRTASLHEKGVISNEEVARTELQVQTARAELMKVKTEVDSLRTLLKELGESRPTMPESSKKVAR